MKRKPQPLISVVMPAFNSQEYIKSSIASVQAQTHRNIELLVVDDGSVDDTVDMVSAELRLDKRIKLLQSKGCSGGPARPRNEGLVQCSGQYVAFIDADDVWHPAKLENQLRALNDYELNFVSTLCHSFVRHLPKLGEQLESADIVKINHSKMLRKNRVVTSSVLIDADSAKQISFNERIEYVAIEDYLAWLTLFQKPDVKGAVLCQRLVYYRLRGDSISSSKIQMARKIFYMLGNYSVEGRPIGLRKYYYFLTYLVLAIKARILNKALRS